MPIRTTPLSGVELLQALEATEVKPSSSHPNGVYDTSDEKVMVAAQQVLIENGFALVESEMAERHFYVMTFARFRGNGDPKTLLLRFMTNGFSYPPLVLMFQDGITWIPFSGRRTYGTNTSNAEKEIVAFEKQFPFVPWRWVPAFERSPLIP